MSDAPSTPSPAAKTIAAMALLAIAPVGFWAVLRLPGEHFLLLQLTTTLPIVIALALLASVYKTRHPNQKPAGWRLAPILCALFFLAVGVGSALLARHIRLENQEFEASAVPGVASISKTLVAPDGITHRIHITIQGEQGKTGENNIEIDPALWKTMKVGDPFPVKYVPQNPSNNRPILTGLAYEPPPNPQNLVLASILGFLGFAVSSVAVIFSFRNRK